ncbi:FimV/HubP family polar landmark protein [Ramlibacter agri]|nr:FimV/HubP family polar landmark protein [Ramlibacter agri]
MPKARLSALALAAALTLTFAPDALALALGRVTVQSALGEPLRADIDLPEITAEEVSSLKANIAPVTVFQSRGVDLSPSLQGVNITLQRRPNGSYFLRLAGDRPTTDPFVDVILEASWSSGRIQRDFTLLLDPPSQRQPAAPLQAQVAPAPSRGTAPAAGTPLPPAARPAPAAPAPRAGTGTASSTPSPAPAPRAATTPAPSTGGGGGEGKKVTVQAGDTAGKIASANKPASISLDQMLVALLRSNPDAFVDGNVNRLKAGAVLDMPSNEQASQVQPTDAHQTLVAQSRDFNEFRHRLAEGLPAAKTPAAQREASGRVQAQVEDKKAQTGSPDKLTLSKGAVAGKGSADRIAKERAAQDASNRVAELNKNIQDLNRLTGTTPGAAPGGAGAKSGPGVTVPAGVATNARPASAPGATTPAGRAASAPVLAAATPAAHPASVAAAATPAKPASVASAAAVTPAAPASAPAAAPAPAPAAAAVTSAASAPSAPATSAASAPVAAASAPAAGEATPVAAAPAPAPAPAPKPVAKKAPSPPPPPEPSFLEDVLDNPLVPALGVGLLAVLLGLGFYKMRQKRKTAAVDSSFLESRLQPDSFFGASGGQRIDTAEANNPTGSSMVYSPSQLDAAGDVDPVAEADVYLAYGRDLQAEEILKEALRINPQRVAIHAKLLEIYAKRRDAKAFETVAAEAYNLTHGTGPEWDHITELGRELDASNPMYRPGGEPGAGAAAAAAAATAGAAAFGSTQPISAAPAPQAAAPAGDLDLDLDFSLGDEPAAPAPAPVAAAPALVARPAPAPAPAEVPPLEMDFGMPPAAPAPALEPVRLDAPGLTLDENSLNFEPSPAPAPAPKAAPAPAPADGLMEFDLGSLSLDLPGSAPAPAPAPAAAAPKAPPAAAPAMPALEPLPVMDLGGSPDVGAADSPLATKLALAEEFNAIGDADGARSLAEEVLAEASGDLKSRAQKLLAEIG